MIQLLCVDISSANKDTYSRLYENASAERQKRADRYLKQQDKLCCVTADALIRKAVGGRYSIIKNQYEKPYIENSDLFFNISHSGHYVVIAYGNSEVGIDIQEHDTDIDTEATGKICFSKDEQEYARGNTERFYEIWTCKESYLKYTGEGIKKDMRSFSVLKTEPRAKKLNCLSDDEYSISLCATDPEYTFELIDINSL